MMIRKMHESDLPQVLALDQRSWTAQTSPVWQRQKSLDDLKQALLRGTQILLAEEGQDILGYLDYQPYYPFPAGHHVVTFGILVDKAYQGQGIGQTLFQAFLDEARKASYRKISIPVLASNHKALAFYEKNGFKEEARLRQHFFIQGHYVDGLILGKDLEDTHDR